VTRDDIKDALIIRLGQRSDLSNNIDMEIQFAQNWVENRPFLPWFLQTTGEDFTLMPGISFYKLPDAFLRELDVAGIKGSLLVADMVDGVVTTGSFEEARKYEPGVLDVRYINTDPCKPLGYSIVGDFLSVAPVPDKEYCARWRTYYARAARLNSAGAQNAWTRESPDSLIAATGLRMAMGYLKSEKVYAEFRAYFDETEAALMKADVARQEAGIVRILGEG
jgi:hypothetical protein